MKENKLKVKDLVTIGVFAVIYFIVYFIVGMIGIVPLVFLFFPMVLGMVTGVVILLFMAKVQKPWALFILGMIPPMATFIMGMTYIVPLHALIIMLIAEFIRRKGDFKSFKLTMLSFAVFNTWSCGSLMQMLWAKDKYMEISSMMGDEYVAALERLITYPNMSLVYLGSIVGGLIGALIGRSMLKKHFEKAGII